VPRKRVTSRAVDARALAHAVLVRVRTTDAFADALLAARLRAARPSPADAALATRLVYGTLAWQARLDHHLTTLVSMPLARLEPAVHAALRLGLYQLLFLERVPAYAAVDASVRVARRTSPAAAGLVNAVLRRAAAGGPGGLPLPDPTADPLGRLAVEWSHPRWLVERWARDFGAGDELARLLAADNRRGPVALRANRLVTDRERLGAELAAAGADTSPGAWAEDALVVHRGAARLRATAAWREGRFTFQGEASQLVTPLLDLVPGMRVLDACAAPGGKAVHAAALLAGRGAVVALDARRGGAARVAREARRLHAAPTVSAVVADARHPPLAGPFDAVLVDAPCSGLGTLRRHPEVRWRRGPEDVARLAALQREILDGVAPLVRAGGTLVYCVCTLVREENADVVDAFRAAHPRFAVDDLARGLGGRARGAVTPEGFLRTLPSRDDLDGFFVARLRARA
jgi:16S rRNA (cytosine967-C5)-methyltransferase